MNNIKGIIFDYGGTLDTQGVHWFHIFREAYAQYLPEVAEEQLREAYVYGERYLATHRVIEPADDFLAMLEKKVAIQFSALGIENAEINADIANYCDGLVRRNMEQTRDVLERLSARYPLVLVSNFYGNIRAVLHTYGIEHYFGAVIESAVVGIRKPDARIFGLGVEALGFSPEEVLVVGDSYDKDIVPAHSLGCRTVWLKGQGWNTAEEDAQECCADKIIYELQDIIS
ncbi:MAG: HAD family hydrolase [Bacteroidaceae bacterium]|nr:HAD family hydrolase [Bacteroidaceae bacterium]